MTEDSSWLMQARLGTLGVLEDEGVRKWHGADDRDCGNGWRWWNSAREPSVHEALQDKNMVEVERAVRHVCNTWSYGWRVITEAGEVLWTLQAEG